MRRLRRSGVPVYVWTVNDERVMKALIRKSADAIITDRPDRLVHIRSRLCM